MRSSLKLRSGCAERAEQKCNRRNLLEPDIEVIDDSDALADRPLGRLARLQDQDHLIVLEGQRLLASAAVVRSPVRISVPNTGQFHTRCRTLLSEEFLNIPIAQREAQVELDRIPNVRRRKAVAPIGDSNHRASLASVSLPRYLVILTYSVEQHDRRLGTECPSSSI